MAAARGAAEMGLALVIASQGNQIVTMCRLITQGADVNYVHRFMRDGKEKSTTPLIGAAINGHADAARVLTSRGAEVNKPEPCNGGTALHMAAHRVHVPVIKLLMSNRARIEARSIAGQTPLLEAAFDGQREAALYLLDHGANISANSDMGFTPLAAAAQEGHLPVVDLLVLRGADVNLANNDGATPLSMAAGKGHLDVVKFLLKKGAVVDQPRNDGCTPLMKAAEKGHLEVVEFLVEKGAVVDLPDNNGCTALGQASLFGHIEVVDCLLSAGANINHLNATGLSPLYASTQGGHLPVVKLLVRRGADINQTSHQGATPLHRAAFQGHKEVVDYLMSKGAKLEAIRTARVTACKCCGATGVRLKKCLGCQTVYYCSPECQKKDWKEGDENRHKIQCARLAGVRAQYEEKVNKEIEEKMAEFGISPSNLGGEEGGAGPSSASRD